MFLSRSFDAWSRYAHHCHMRHTFSLAKVFYRETREGWPLLTYWNWGEWGLKEYKWKGSFLGWFFGLILPTRDLCSALAALVSPAQNIFFLTVHYFNSFLPIAQQARQAPALGRLSLRMCECELRIETEGRNVLTLLDKHLTYWKIEGKEAYNL